MAVARNELYLVGPNKAFWWDLEGLESLSWQGTFQRLWQGVRVGPPPGREETMELPEDGQSRGPHV